METYRQVTIEITQEDINAGETGNCRYCPIALAFRRILKDEFYATIGISFFRIRKGGIENYHSVLGNTEFTGYDLSSEAKTFILNFDLRNGKNCKPFSFYVEIPERFVK